MAREEHVREERRLEHRQTLEGLKEVDLDIREFEEFTKWTSFKRKHGKITTPLNKEKVMKVFVG